MVTLNYHEAEFLAKWIDATLREFSRMKVNANDYLVAQAFLGNEMPAGMGEEDLLLQVDETANGLKIIRERINEGFGI